MRKEIKLRLDNIIAKPTLLFASETWILGEEDKKRIEISGTRFMKSLLDVTLRDRMRSAYIRKELETVTTMVEAATHYLNNWYSHVRLSWQTFTIKQREDEILDAWGRAGQTSFDLQLGTGQKLNPWGRRRIFHFSLKNINSDKKWWQNF